MLAEPSEDKNVILKRHSPLQENEEISQIDLGEKVDQHSRCVIFGCLQKLKFFRVTVRNIH